MQPVLNVEDVRAVEEALVDVGVSLSELMHRAGASIAQEVMRMGDVTRVVVLTGLGNNGGDGWVAAERLMRHGIDVHVVTPVPPTEVRSNLAHAVATAAEGSGVEIIVAPPRERLEELVGAADVVIDALLGTGFHGVPRAPFDIWIDVINEAATRIVAADVPSGLSAQTGHAEGAHVIADITVTMLALKPGLISDRGRDAAGSIVVAPLAEQTERLVLDADPVAWRADLVDYLDVIEPQNSSYDKFERGSVLVVGGSTRFPGAVIMAAKAAARAGAGYVTLAVPASIAGIVQTHLLEIPVIAMPDGADGSFSPDAARAVAKLAEKRSATLVGPGMRVSAGTVAVTSKLIESSVPLVIDADGLNCLARLTSNRLDEFPELLRRDAPVVLTPHRGELGRLVGLPNDPPTSLTAMLDAARRIVWSEGGSELCVIAKGSATACVGVEAAVLPKPGPGALATAGSGDALGGIMASLLAQGSLHENSDLPMLASLACEIHGYAGAIAVERFGSRGIMATDVIDAIGLASDALAEQAAYDDLPANE